MLGSIGSTVERAGATFYLLVMITYEYATVSVDRHHGVKLRFEYTHQMQSWKDIKVFRDGHDIITTFSRFSIVQHRWGQFRACRCLAGMWTAAIGVFRKHDIRHVLTKFDEPLNISKIFNILRSCRSMYAGL